MKRASAKARIDMRAPEQDKHYLEMAAFLAGYKSLTDFLLEAGKARADELFSNSSLEELSEEDSMKFMEMCQNAPAPNERLKKAYSKIASHYKFDKSGNVVENVPDTLFVESDKRKSV